MVKIRMFFRIKEGETITRDPIDRGVSVVPRIGEDIVMRDGTVWEVRRISHYFESPSPVHLWMEEIE